MKQSTPERRSSLFKISFSLWMTLSFLFSSISFAQLTTETGPATNSYGSSATMGSSGAALNADLIQQGQYDMANRAYADAVAQQQAALAAQQAAQAQQAALLAQQQAMNPAASGVNAAGLMGLCGSMLSSLSSVMGSKNVNSTKEFTAAMDSYNESQGNQYDPGISEEVSRKVAQDSYDPESLKNYGSSAGLCNQFMDKDGKIGPLGRLTMQEIEKYPSSFEDKNLTDMNQMCPKYNSMEPEKKKLFWVRFFSILAYKESSCNPLNDNVPGPKNPNAPPNGTAYGLFQLDKGACGSIDFHNPNENTRCAIKRMAKEMSNRSTMSTPCSNPRGCAKYGLSTSKATYWGELRNDDNNPNRKGDTKAAVGLRRAVASYTYCH